MENEDVKVDETTSSPSEENQTAEEGTIETPVESVEEVKQIPYDRFKEVIDERNKYKELIGTLSQTPAQPQVKTPDYQEEDVASTVKPLIDDVVDKKIGQISRQLELDRTIAQNPDFFKYADSIKEKIQENPHLNWNDAYKLAKFDYAQYEAREQGKIEATQKIQEKRRATVETASKAKSSRPSGGIEEINPLAKGPDGRFLFSTRELEDILPRK